MLLIGHHGDCYLGRERVSWQNRSLDYQGVVQDEVGDANRNRKWVREVSELLNGLQHDQVEDPEVADGRDQLVQDGSLLVRAEPLEPDDADEHRDVDEAAGDGRHDADRLDRPVLEQAGEKVVGGVHLGADSTKAGKIVKQGRRGRKRNYWTPWTED